MARFSDDLIHSIKQDISLVQLVKDWGVVLKKQGKDYLGHCPFHDDKTPSLVISPESNLWHCLGACGEGGSVIDWVMKTQGVSFRHAIELLKSDLSSLAASVASDRAVPVKKTTTPKLDAPVTQDADDQKMLRQVIEYYHTTLKESPEALAYLEKRGLADADLIDTFQLGYANRTLGLRLPQKTRKAGKEIREQLQRIGLYRDTGREHFNGSLVVPVANEQGVITEVYGRKTQESLRAGTPKHTYLPGPHEGVFNPLGLHNTEEVILCESLIDALTFWRWGFRHVTCSYGVNGFTDELLQAFIHHKIKRVLIAYDRDEAGDKAATELATRLNQHGMDAFRVQFPKGMDANEYACQMSPPQKALGLVIRKAEWLGSGAGAPKLTTVAELPSQATDADILPSFTVPMHPAPTALAHPCASAASVAEEEQDKSVTTKPEEPVKPELNDIDTQATPVPPLPRSDVQLQLGEQELFITIGPRVYRVRGLESGHSHDQMRIQLMARQDEAFHMDKLDLYSHKQRQVFINQASVELGLTEDILKKDLGKVLLALENHQAEQQKEQAEVIPSELEPEARQAALSLLNDPNLMERILTDFNQAGVVGEETNKLTGYLACVSRQLDRPLAVIIQSSSAAGKSSLMEAILALMPEEERVQYSAMTGQSLFYMGETNLKHKILAITEEEGAHNASYALKLLQSEGEVTIASTGKDDTTGQLVTREYRVEGPVMLFMTTTAIDIDEELMNRCLVLTVNESREQTQAIHQAQRMKRTLQGLQARLDKDRIIQLHRNAQRLLKPLAVINPYADQLTFLDDKTRTRRDHEKYLTLIDSIALLHQYQRPVKSATHQNETLTYIEVTLDDIAMANRLAHEVLGKTLDELPPQTRKLLKLIQQMVQRDCQAQGIEQRDYRFSRRQVRDATGWGNTQLKLHCRRLEDMEYLLIHKGGRGQTFEYELLYSSDMNDDQAQLMGLIDVARLGKTEPSQMSATQNYDYDANWSGVNDQKSGPGRPQVGGMSAPGRAGEIPQNPHGYGAYVEKQFDFVENAYLACKRGEVS